MLTRDELDQLRTDLLDLIDIRAARLLGVPRWCLRGLPAAEVAAARLEVDAGLREVVVAVSRELTERALAAGMSQAAVARARSVSRQAVNRRVNAG
jgi:hypothetical protein